jgi:hypothetical protein
VCLSYDFWRPPPAGANFEGGKLVSLTHTPDSDSGLAAARPLVSPRRTYSDGGPLLKLYGAKPREV